MTALTDTPTNINFLSPLNFKFQIKRAPHLNFFVQKVNIPRIILPKANIPTPLVEIPTPGEHITYEALSMNFKVDEDLQNYLEIHNWIKALGTPSNFDEYYKLEQQPQSSGLGIVSDLELIALTSSKTANYAITFEDAWPYELGGLQFDTTAEDVDFLTTDVSFYYRMYEISKI